MPYNSSLSYRQEAYFGYMKLQKRGGLFSKVFYCICALVAILGTALFLLFVFARDPFLFYLDENVLGYIRISGKAEEMKVLKNDILRGLGLHELPPQSDVASTGLVFLNSGERAVFFQLPKGIEVNESALAGEREGLVLRRLKKNVYVVGDATYVHGVERRIFRFRVFTRNIMLAWQSFGKANGLVNGVRITALESRLSERQLRWLGGNIFFSLNTDADGVMGLDWSENFFETAPLSQDFFFEYFPTEATLLIQGTHPPVPSIFQGFSPLVHDVFKHLALNKGSWQWFLALTEGNNPNNPLAWRFLASVELQVGENEEGLMWMLEDVTRDIAAGVNPLDRPVLLPDGTWSMESVKDKNAFVFVEKEGKHLLQTPTGNFFYEILEKNGRRFLIVGNEERWLSALQSESSEEKRRISEAYQCGAGESVDAFALVLTTGVFQEHYNYLANFKEIFFNFDQHYGCFLEKE